MKVNKLKLNDSKTEFFIAASDYYQRQRPDIALTIDDSCIKPSQTIRNFGAIFVSKPMAEHITNLSGTITFHLRYITRIRRFIDKDTCHYAVHSLVLSRRDYCNGLLSSVPKSHILRLQRLQNWAARIIFIVDRRHESSPLLKSLPLASSETKNHLQITVIRLQSIEWSCTYVYI